MMMPVSDITGSYIFIIGKIKTELKKLSFFFICFMNPSGPHSTPIHIKLNIKCTFIGLLLSISATAKLPPEKFQTQDQKKDQPDQPQLPTELKKFILNSGEELYAELRDKNFNAVGPILSRRAKMLTSEFDVS